MSAPEATIRDSAWKPMSYIAPSPPMTHRRRSAWPAWSQRARMPRATAGRVLEQRVRPRHEVRVVRVGAAEDRVAAGGGDDAHRFRPVDLARRGDEHPDRRRLAAAGARARAADVAEGVLAEHQVGEGLLVAVCLGCRRQRPEEAHVAGDSARASPRRAGLAALACRSSSASWPSALHTSTHSAQPLQWIGSTKIPNVAGSRPRRAGTSPYFVVWAKCASRPSRGGGWFRFAGRRTPRSPSRRPRPAGRCRGSPCRDRR